MRASKGRLWLTLLFAFFGCVGCCCHPEVTAVSLSPQNCGEPCGIPFYLPKPLLIIAKNFRNIEDARVGLTDPAPIPNGFDDQARYADVNSRSAFVNTTNTTGTAQTTPSGAATTTVTGTTAPQNQTAKQAPVTPGPGETPADGLTPDTFYTYQIVFVPDLTQKYALRVKGGVGEIRAAMNLVNGWQFTGLGPFYLKDSSTAQNVLASGIAANLALTGAGSVIQDLAHLGGAGGHATAGNAPTQVTSIIQRIEKLGPLHPVRLEGYAEIHVYEPYLTSNNTMEWRPVTDLTFFRDFLGTSRQSTTNQTVPPQTQSNAAPAGQPTAALVDPALARAVLARKDRFAALGLDGKPNAALVGTPPAGQVNVNQYCPSGGNCGVTNRPILTAIAGKMCRKKPPAIEQHILAADDSIRLSDVTSPTQSTSVNQGTPAPKSVPNPPQATQQGATH